MRVLKSIQIVSRICALAGAVLSLGISVLFIINLLDDRNWVAAFFLFLLIALNILVIIYNWKSKSRVTPMLNAGASLAIVFFIFLARFSIGLFFTLPAMLLVIAAILGFIPVPGQSLGRYSQDPQLDIPSSSKIEEKDQGVRLTDQLTFRERQVLLILMQGCNNQEIAQKLVISPNTVRRHVHQIFKKLNCSSRVQAAVVARREGLS